MKCSWTSLKNVVCPLLFRLNRCFVDDAIDRTTRAAEKAAESCIDFSSCVARCEAGVALGASLDEFAEFSALKATEKFNRAKLLVLKRVFKLLNAVGIAGTIVEVVDCPLQCSQKNAGAPE